jgi:hypothetical protein
MRIELLLFNVVNGLRAGGFEVRVHAGTTFGSSLSFEGYFPGGKGAGARRRHPFLPLSGAFA